MTTEEQDTIDNDLPGEWRTIDPAFPDFQLDVVRHDEREKVLAVEKRPGHAPWDHGEGYQTVLLPEMYHENTEIKDVLARNVSKDEAIDIALTYMEAHP